MKSPARLGTLALVALALLPLMASSAAAQRTHRVRRGDSFARIARHFHVSVWDLALANHSRPSHGLTVGDQLEIPDEGEVYVRPGYSLGRIARNNHTDVDALRRQNHLRDSDHLHVGQRLYLPGHEAHASSHTQRDWGTPEEPGVLRLRSTRAGGEVQRVRLRDSAGRVPEEGLEELSLSMRRHEDAERREPHPRLAILLAAISDHFGGRTITIVSGFREARRFTSEASQHVSGRATDIQIEGVGKRALFDFCRSLGETGCGYYPHTPFVHVDARETAAQWVDWSRPGRRPRYGTLRRPYHRREQHAGRVPRNVTLPDAVPLNVQVVAANGATRPAEVTGTGESSGEAPGG